MSVHREEGQFTVRVDLSAEFGDDDDSDDDGYVWLEAWRRKVLPKLVKAVFDSLRSDPRFDAIASPRGASPDEVLEIAVRWRGRTGAGEPSSRGS